MGMQENLTVCTRLSKKDYKKLDKIVQKGDYLNMSDALREAVRNFIEKETGK